MSLLDPGQESEGPTDKRGKGGVGVKQRERKQDRKDVPERRGEVGCAGGTEWYKGVGKRGGGEGGESQHESPNGSSILRLAVYWLQGNLSTGTDPGPADVTDGEEGGVTLTDSTTSKNPG